MVISNAECGDGGGGGDRSNDGVNRRTKKVKEHKEFNENQGIDGIKMSYKIKDKLLIINTMKVVIFTTFDFTAPSTHLQELGYSPTFQLSFFILDVSLAKSKLLHYLT